MQGPAQAVTLQRLPAVPFSHLHCALHKLSCRTSFILRPRHRPIPRHVTQQTTVCRAVALSGAHGDPFTVLFPQQITKRIKQCQSWRDLAAVVEQYKSSFNYIHVSAAVTHAAQLLAAASDPAPATEAPSAHAGGTDVRNLQQPPRGLPAAPAAAAPGPGADSKSLASIGGEAAARVAGAAAGVAGAAAPGQTAHSSNQNQLVLPQPQPQPAAAGGTAVLAGSANSFESAEFQALLSQLLGLIALHAASFEARQVANSMWALSKLATCIPQEHRQQQQQEQQTEKEQQQNLQQQRQEGAQWQLLQQQEDLQPQQQQQPGIPSPSRPPPPTSSLPSLFTQLHTSAHLLLLQASLHWPQLQPQELSLLLWSLSQLYPQPSSISGLRSWVEPAQLNPEGVRTSSGFSSVSRLVRSWVGPALQQLLTLHSYSRLKPQELIMLMGSLAWVREFEERNEGEKSYGLIV